MRFFTVFGPRQRPDLAIHKFTKLISENQEIPFYGDGSTARDYTFINDIVDEIIKSIAFVEKNKNIYEENYLFDTLSAYAVQFCQYGGICYTAYCPRNGKQYQPENPSSEKQGKGQNQHYYQGIIEKHNRACYHMIQAF